jgi:long-chain acyl-CoA synthetase
MKHLLINSFKKFQNKTMIISQDRRITYNKFYKQSLILCEFLKKRGLKENDKILIVLENSLDYLIIFMACMFGGFVACPIDPTTKKNRINELKKIYDIKYTINKKIYSKKKKINEKLINLNNTNFLVIGTSGHDGKTKGILFNTDSIIKSAKSFSKLAKYDKKTKILHCLPMFYMGGILDTFFASIIGGSTIILNKKFSIMNILKFWDLPIKHNANILFLTPSIIAMVCSIFKKPSNELSKHISKYKLIIATGSKLYSETRIKFFELFKKKISVCYGATELGGPISLQIDNECFKKDGGKISKDTSIKIIKKNNKKYIYVKTPFLMKGFLIGKKFEKVQLDNGYFNSGDLGSFKNKILKITGRDRQIIKRGGELIHLSYIESVSSKSNLINQALAFGKKDINAGEELYLAIKLNNNNNKFKDLKKFSNFLTKNLRNIEVPKKIFVLKNFKKNSLGEIKKFTV